MTKRLKKSNKREWRQPEGAFGVHGGWQPQTMSKYLSLKHQATRKM